MISKWPKVIYLETTILRELPIHIVNAQFEDLENMCRNRDIKIVVPEVALDELIYARKCKMKEKIETVNRIVDSPLLQFSKPTVKWPMSEDEMIRTLENQIHLILEQHSIDVIKTPNLDCRKLLKMAVEKIPPFERKGEKGFRDSAIMFTIIDFAKTFDSEDLHLLISNDKAFQKEEVLDRFKSEKVHIVPSESIDEARKDLEMLLDDEIAKQRAERSETLRRFLEGNQEQIAKYMDSILSSDPYFFDPALGWNRPYLVHSAHLEDLRMLQNVTPGSLPQGQTQGKLKISFSVEIHAVFFVTRPDYHGPERAFETPTGYSREPAVAPGDYTVRYPILGPEEDRTFRESIRRSLLFEGSARLQKEAQKEIYSDLTIDRVTLT